MSVAVAEADQHQRANDIGDQCCEPDRAHDFSAGKGAAGGVIDRSAQNEKAV